MGLINEKTLESYLLSLGYDNSEVPYRFHADSHYITYLGTDSFDCIIIGVDSKRFCTTVFRGRVISTEQIDDVLFMVKEDYDLTKQELERIK